MADQTNKSIKTVSIDEGTVCIKDEEFYEYKFLEQITLPASVTTIGNYAFRGCSSLADINLPASVTTIGDGAFDGCSSLADINLPASVTTIGDGAFCGCSSLADINLPASVTTAGGDIFEGCSALTAIDIPGDIDIQGCMEFFRNNKATVDPALLVYKSWPKECQKESLQGNTMLLFFVAENFSLAFIKCFLDQVPTAIKQTNTLGQTPLHLSIVNKSDLEIISFIIGASREAETEKNELGKTPVDYWRENGSDEKIGKLFRNCDAKSTNNFFLMQDGSFATVEKEPEILHGRHLTLELPHDVSLNVSITTDNLDRDGGGPYFQEKYGIKINETIVLKDYFKQQMQARNKLFDELLTEFADLIECNDKGVIQRAAAIEALSAQCQGVKVPPLINFDSFSSSAYWYQQEILSLVLRAYCEDQYLHDDYKSNFLPSCLIDSEKAFEDLKLKADKLPPPSDNRKDSFTALTKYITDGLDKDKYKFEGPVLKSLQSLFNKIYIRRGQTKVNIIGDMTRATLYIKDRADLKKVIDKIKMIIGDDEKLDKIGPNEFIKNVFDRKKIPETHLIPYRMKVNSSQKDNDEKLLYNLNFFDNVPELHRVGNTEMFVAFELQIGLQSEIERLRKHHVAYEKKRILESQPLLNAYLKAEKAPNAPLPCYSSAFINEITAILEGTFSNLNLTTSNDEEFDTSTGRNQGEMKTDVPLCLNNTRLNVWARDDKVMILDGPFQLNPKKHYIVNSLEVSMRGEVHNLSIGLFAVFNKYMMQLTAQHIGGSVSKDGNINNSSNVNVSLIKSQMNYLTMENISKVPYGCGELVIVAWGEPKHSFGNGSGPDTHDLDWIKVSRDYYKGSKIELKKYEEKPIHGTRRC